MCERAPKTRRLVCEPPPRFHVCSSCLRQSKTLPWHHTLTTSCRIVLQHTLDLLLCAGQVATDKRCVCSAQPAG